MDNIQIFPQNRRVKEGGIATFTCRSSGHTKWYFEKEDTLPLSKPIWRSDRIVIRNVHKIHSGYYYCYGLYSDIVTHFVAKSKIEVYGAFINTLSLYVIL